MTRRDFRHIGEPLDTLLDYLKQACRARTTGANVLLCGPPGTGKTELARWLVGAIRCPAFEIKASHDNTMSSNAAERLSAWRLCQGIVPEDARRVIVFDEVEEILSNEIYASHGFRRSAQFSKGYLNELLETNPLPTIWVTNTLRGVDPAYLLRFDITLNLQPPSKPHRKRIAKRAFADLPTSDELLNAIAAQPELTPAYVEKASRVCRMLGAQDAARVETVTRHVLDEDLQAMHCKPLSKMVNKPSKTQPKLSVDTSVINVSVDPDALLNALGNSGFGRLCFHGPSGTGKSALAAEIARHLKRPLLVKQASDILGPFVGMSERNISRAFAEADKEGAVLLIDEADSFLQERRRAEKHWETTQVNHFLTSLEHHEGYVICTTNVVSGIDATAVRRFDYKIEFGYMNDTQSKQMVAMVMKALGKGGTRINDNDLEALTGHLLVPGDYAIALRQAVIDRKRANVKAIVDSVLSEARWRAPKQAHAMGFI